MMLTIVAIVAIPLLWFAAMLAQRRTEVSRVWLAFDAGVGIVIAILLASDGRLVEGVLLGLVVTPVLILFSVVRTVQMRYVDRKTRAILGSSPGLQDANDERGMPRRRVRRGQVDGNE